MNVVPEDGGGVVGSLIVRIMIVNPSLSSRRCGRGNSHILAGSSQELHGKCHWKGGKLRERKPGVCGMSKEVDGWMDTGLDGE